LKNNKLYVHCKRIGGTHKFFFMEMQTRTQIRLTRLLLLTLFVSQQSGCENVSSD